MKYIEYLSKYTPIPQADLREYAQLFFIDDEIERDLINITDVAIWLDVTLDNLIKKLKKYYKANEDYFMMTNNKLYIKSDIVKDIAMSCKTKKADKIRELYLAIERNAYKYISVIRESMGMKIKKSDKEGIVYILEAMNVDANIYTTVRNYDSQNDKQNTEETRLISKSNNQINPIFIMKSNDIDGVKQCIKHMIKNHMYDKKKGIYEIKIDLLKHIISECDVLIDSKFNSGKKTKNVHVGRLAEIETDDEERLFYIKFVKTGKKTKSK